MEDFQFYSDQTTEGKIVASLERISQAFRVLLWKKSKEFSLTPLQVQILIFLFTQNEEKKKVSYLAKEFNVTKATISDTVKTLEQKHLVVKDNEATDSKEIYSPIAELSWGDKKNVLSSLIKLIIHLNKTGVISVLRMCTTCSYYRPSDDEKKGHCTLLKRDLDHVHIRVDCREHKMLDFPTTV